MPSRPIVVSNIRDSRAVDGVPGRLRQAGVRGGRSSRRPGRRDRAPRGSMAPPGMSFTIVGDMTVRQQIEEMLRQPRTTSSIAHELKLTRQEVEDHLKHVLK